MSWSIITLGSMWAHAHDIEQVSFMYLAPIFLEQSDQYKNVPWLNKWKEYWKHHRSCYGNGCSDLDLESYLTCTERMNEFSHFLDQFSVWLNSLKDKLSDEYINRFLEGETYPGTCNVSSLLQFANTIKAVLRQDTTNQNVFKNVEA